MVLFTVIFLVIISVVIFGAYLWKKNGERTPVLPPVGNSETKSVSFYPMVSNKTEEELPSPQRTEREERTAKTQGPDYALELAKLHASVFGSLTEVYLDEFRDVWNLLKTNFPENTERQVYQAVMTIYSLRSYYPSLTPLDAMDWLLAEVPNDTLISATNVKLRDSTMLGAEDDSTQLYAGRRTSADVNQVDISAPKANAQEIAARIYRETVTANTQAAAQTLNSFAAQQQAQREAIRQNIIAKRIEAQQRQELRRIEQEQAEAEVWRQQMFRHESFLENRARNNGAAGGY